jgi:uncharacterized membrane protein
MESEPHTSSGHSGDSNPRPKHPKVTVKVPDSEDEPAVVIAEGVSPAEAKAIGDLVLETSLSFSGPLPPPEILARYDDALPGCVDRILRMTEEQGKHDRSMQQRALQYTYYERVIGQLFGLIIGLVAIGCGTYAIVNGAQIAGTIIAGVGLAGLVSVFVVGRKTQDEQPEDEPKPTSE